MDFISFVGLELKKYHFNDPNSVSELELAVSKIHCIEFHVTNIFFFRYNMVTSMRQVSLSSSTYTFTKTLHKKIWMKNICVQQLSQDVVIQEAKKWLLWRLTPKGPGLVIHQNHLKTATLRCDIIRFFQNFLHYFQPLDL